MTEPLPSPSYYSFLILTRDLIAVPFTSIRKALFFLPTPVPNFNYTKHLSHIVQPDSLGGGGKGAL